MLSQKARYALRALVELARAEGAQLTRASSPCALTRHASSSRRFFWSCRATGW